MKSNFKPYESVLDLNFGKISYEIQNKLNISPSQFEKVSGVIVDDFKIMHVEYKNKKSVAYEIELDYYGFTSYKYGFSIYGDPEENIVESAMFFEKDYFINELMESN